MSPQSSVGCQGGQHVCISWVGCIHGQTSGHPNVGGELLRENWKFCIPIPIMAVHSPPLQGSQDIGSINGSIICKDLKPPDYLIIGPKGTLDLMSMSRDVAATVHEHFLLLGLLLLQVPFECLASMLLFLSGVLDGSWIHVPRG